MADLFVFLPNHGYVSTVNVYVSWLDGNFWTANETQNAFKLTTTDGGAIYVQFSESVIDGFVREVTEAGVTSITGLDHLEGEQVYVTSNGISLGLFTVSSGSVTVLTNVFNYTVGLPYESTLQPMKIDLDGIGLASTKKIPKALLSLNKTVGGKVGPNAQNLDAIKYRDAGDTTSKEFPYFTGDVSVPLPGGYNRNGDIMVKQSEPSPITVLAFTLDLGANND